MNKLLSTVFNLIAISIVMMSILLFILHLFGDLQVSPLDIVLTEESANAPRGAISNVISLLSTPVLKFMQALSYIPIGLLFGLLFQTLSKRYRFESWAAMKTEDEKQLKASFKSAGNIEDVEFVKGGFLSPNEIIIKTEKGIYRCLGNLSSYAKNAEVKIQYGDLILRDASNKEHRLRLI